MKHIKTASAEETSMRKAYRTSTDPSPVKASKEHEDAVSRIVENTRKMDLLKLEISRDVGKLMGYIQGHQSLQDSSGKTLVTWINSSDREEIDYDSLLSSLDVPPSKIAEFTTVKPGSRVFTITD